MSAGVLCACLFFAIAATTIGVVGIFGVHTATRTGHQIADDELSTATITAQLEREFYAAYADGQALAISSSQTNRGQLAARLANTGIPAVEAGLAELNRIHTDDRASEIAGISELNARWNELRTLLNTEVSQAQSERASATALSTVFEPLSNQTSQLISREAVDAQDDQSRAAALAARTNWSIVVAVVVSVAISIGLGSWGSRRLRSAVEPARDQVEFADTLQLAEDDGEAHQLLQRHIERSVTGGNVTVLNRNNSADRLEAVTPVPSESPLRQSLEHAEPRSCLAVRSARVHSADHDRHSLISCPVCGECPGRSLCTPLTVGGEVIGSVLVNRTSRYNPVEQQSIRESVAQAAPVLANLRNLAIAELRAATDSLTGLPNKRAVADNLKRMLAQASWTLTPLALLVLDLDHFKEIIDRYGHPVGDQTLANVGAAIRSALRDSDFAGRNGGEEFAVLLPDTDIQGASVTADKIGAAIAEIALPGMDLAVTASVGIAAYPQHSTGSERLERLADAALYVAKRSGRNRVEIASSPAEEAAISLLDPGPTS
jgi:diguanylate cyclase (GGDEF)-like protein